jgi:general secretion pathway protein C
MIVSMREAFPYSKITYLLVFLCVSVAAFLLSSFALSLLNSRLGPVQPRPLIQALEAGTNLPAKLPLEHYQSIWEKNVFFTTSNGGTETSEPVQVDQLSLTSLNCSLVGTMVQEEGDGWAVIMDNDDSRQDMVTVGSHIKGARVVRILKDKVVLNINGKDELLLMDMEESPETASAAPVQRVSSRGRVLTYNVSRSLVQQSLNDLTSLMSKVRAEPYFRGGRPDGFRLSRIQPGSLLTSAGFQNGDIIKSVNGRNIATAEDAVRLFDTMKDSSFFRVDIVRDNGPKTIQIRVR